MFGKIIRANILKKLRTYYKYTQKDVADKIGIAQNTYSSYESEKNEPSIDTMIELADLYQVPLDLICGRYAERIIIAEVCNFNDEHEEPEIPDSEMEEHIMIIDELIDALIVELKYRIMYEIDMNEAKDSQLESK